MSAKGKAAVVLAVAAIGVVGAAAGYAVTHDWPASPVASASGPTASTAAPTAAPAPASTAAGDPAAGPEDTSGATLPAGDGARPSSGQTLATDPPVVVTSSTVPVVMTYSGWNAASRRVMAGGYVTGVIEDGGTCTLTLTRNGVRVSAHGPARPDASTTACGGLTVSGGKLTSGTWKAVLSYASTASAGASSAVDVDVTP